MAKNLGLCVMATPPFPGSHRARLNPLLSSMPRAVGLFMILNSNAEFERL
jgi:hypothetical protein